MAGGDANDVTLDERVVGVADQVGGVGGKMLYMPSVRGSPYGISPI